MYQMRHIRSLVLIVSAVLLMSMLLGLAWAGRILKFRYSYLGSVLQISIMSALTVAWYGFTMGVINRLVAWMSRRGLSFWGRGAVPSESMSLRCVVCEGEIFHRLDPGDRMATIERRMSTVRCVGCLSLYDVDHDMRIHSAPSDCGGGDLPRGVS
jgi:hypothetical protein